MIRLQSEILGTRVEYGTGESLGKVRDIIVDTTRARWPVQAIVVGAGTPRREELLEISGANAEVDVAGRRILLHRHAPGRGAPHRASSASHMRLSALDRAQVKTQDGKVAGRIYDAALATATREWRVVRLLVQPKGFKEPRLRLAPSDVLHVKGKEIVVNLSREDARDEALGTARGRAE